MKTQATNASVLDIFFQWKQTLALLLAVAVLATGCRADREHVEALKTGLDSGKEIASALNEQNFEGSLGRIASKASRFLSVVSPAFAIVLAVVPSGESELERGFRELHQHLDVISSEIKEVMDKIEWQSAKSAYASSTLKISNLNGTLHDIMNSRAPSVRQSHLNKFKRQFESGINGHSAAQNLFDALVGQGSFFTQNLAEAAMAFTGRHRTRVRKFLMGVANLVIKGAELEIAYYTIIGDSAEAIAEVSNTWSARLRQMKDKMQEVDRQCESSWHEQSGRDLDRLLARNERLGNEDFKSLLHRYLSEKFYWRTWFIAVFDEFCSHSWFSSGAYDFNKQKNKQKVSQSGGHERLCTNQRSTVVASSEPTGFNAVWDRKARDALQSIDRSVAYAWAGDWYSKLTRQLSGFNFKFIGVICTDCHLAYTSLDRVVTKTLQYGDRYCFRYCNDYKRKPMEAILFY